MFLWLGNGAPGTRGWGCFDGIGRGIGSQIRGWAGDSEGQKGGFSFMADKFPGDGELIPGGQAFGGQEVQGVLTGHR